MKLRRLCLFWAGNLVLCSTLCVCFFPFFLSLFPFFLSLFCFFCVACCRTSTSTFTQLLNSEIRSTETLLQDHQIYCLQVCTCALFSPEISHFGTLKGLIYLCTVAYTAGKQDRPHRLLRAEFTRLQPLVKQIITK